MSLGKKIKNAAINSYVSLCRLFCKTDNEKVVFVSFHGKSYSDNPRAVSEALHEIRPQTKIVWAFKSGADKDIPSYIKPVDIDNMTAYYKELATCSAFVTNYGLQHIPKSDKQFFVQTWHGDRGFKKILYDIAPDRGLVNEAIDGYCDLAIAGCELAVKVYRSAFRYKGEILKSGMPRNDILIHPDEARGKRTREKLGINENVRLMLYAPTMRRESKASRSAQKMQNIDINRTLDALEKKTECRWKCLLRAHPSSFGLEGAKSDGRIIDASEYSDMADLLLVSDMLITDYSSCAGDFALLGRPLILFQSDRDEYLENDRTFYFDIDKSPYYAAKDQRELEEMIETLDDEKARVNCSDILEFYGTAETGHASRSVAERISSHINSLRNK